MKYLMLLLLASSLHAQTSLSAFGWFTDPQGNVGAVNVTRQTVSGVTTTTLFYSFCIETTAASCAYGAGTIPNAAFVGTLDSSFKPSKLTFAVDTAQLPATMFSNNVCTPELGPNSSSQCQTGTVQVGTGGPIFLTFVRVTNYAEFIQGTDKIYRFKSLSFSSLGNTNQFSGSMTGQVLGVTAVNATGAVLGTTAYKQSGTR